MEPSPRTMIGVELIQNVYNGHDRRELPQNDTIPISSAAVDSGISLRSADQHARDQQAGSTTVPWTQFCDDCAKFAAYDFAQSWFNYLADNVVNLASSPAEFDVDEKLVALKFCRSFVGYFESEARRICRSSRLLNETSAFCSATVNTIVTSRHDRVAIDVKRTFFRHRSSEHDIVDINHRSSAENGDQTSISDNNTNNVRVRSTTTTTTIVRRNPSGGNGNAPSSTKSSRKTVVEVVKDGTVNFVSGKDLDGKKWEKGRLCLIKTAGGYLLEFYSPPKAQNYMEYVVQAKDLDDMKSWISVIRHCTDFPLDDGSTEIDLNPVQLRPRLTSAPASDSPRIRHCESLPATRGANRVTPQRSSGHFGRVIINDAVDTVSVGSASGAQSQGQQQLHRSLSTGHDVAYRVRNSNNAAIAASMNDRRMIGGSQTLDVDSARMMGGGGAARTISPSLRSRANLEYRRSGDLFASFTSTLHEFPWFHGLMSRSDAAMLILQAGRDGHGLFIVRQSETRLGEYVLTFNCYGRAKHIRLNICSDGKAQVLNLSFGSIFDVLEFYRQNEIPFENGGSGANFLAAEHQQQQMGISTSGSLGHYVIAWPPHNRSRRSRHDPCDPRDYMSHDGSVRIRTRSLERMAVRMSRNAAAAQLATSDNDAAVSSAALTPHRPENSYQMV